MAAGKAERRQEPVEAARRPLPEALPEARPDRRLEEVAVAVHAGSWHGREAAAMRVNPNKKAAGTRGFFEMRGGAGQAWPEIHCFSAACGAAPVLRSTSWPSLKIISVGIDMMP